MNGDEPIVLHGLDWERLPTGEFGLVVDCLTKADFDALPEWLNIKGERYLRHQWYRQEQRASYQNWSKLVESVRELM